MKLSNILVLTFAVSVIMGMTPSAFAQRDTNGAKQRVPIKPVVKYRDWSVYQHKTGDDVICFAASAPKDMMPKEVKRSEVLFYVTRWKSNPKKAQISLLIGYPFRDGSKPDIKIKAQEFKLFVKGDKAWIRDEGDEALLIRSMKKGSTMTVTGLSTQNIVTTDKFSLSGISKALSKVKRLCR